MLPYQDFYLGRNESTKDVQDWKLASFMPEKIPSAIEGANIWGFLHDPLNQGKTPRCVGYAGAGFGICLPIQDNFSNQDGDDIYAKCKVVDGQPGMQNGSSVRSLAKVLQAMGLIKNYAFAHTTGEITWWLLNKGPVIVGTKWYTDMFTPDIDNIIHPTGKDEGGHCYFFNEKVITPHYYIQNSWDDMWGIKGRAMIAIADFEGLLADGGEALAAVEVDHSLTDTSNNGCLAAIFKMLGLK